MKSLGSHERCSPHVPYVYSQWCYIDSLDGKPLGDGEELEVRWVDGCVGKVTVRVEKRSEPYNDMGHQYKMPVHKAFIVVTHHGVEALVRLGDAVTSAERLDP